MSRFGSDPHAFFDNVYQTSAPWDIGGAQPAMASLLVDFPPIDPILDVGCGSGDLAIHLARSGHAVTGIDFVETAISQANEKSAALPADVARLLQFQVADATKPSRLGRRFGSVVDSGFLHLLDPDEADDFLADLCSVIVPGGRYYLHEFSVALPAENMPRQVTEAELRGRFEETQGWRILDIRTAEFHSRVAPPVAAIAACIERLVEP